MKKQRFRDLKQGKITTLKAPQADQSSKSSSKVSTHGTYATSRDKIKAFLTDAFMLVMPILYVVIYLVLDGREDFAAHRVFGWILFLVPLVIVQSTFMYFSGQTPGYRAYNITLIDEKTQQRPSLFVIVFRNLCAILSLFTLLGWALMFFRKDSKTLHDLLSATALIKTDMNGPQ